uniref:uncharacterized protein LOC120334517 n=1 Tax=Styela clava TaxID=7725 RepID=UPI0019399DA8|nr:uncharacterized protein LOC120334517 [Styela clava]
MKLFIAILLCAGTFLCSAESENERRRRSTPFCVFNPPSKNPVQCKTTPVSRCSEKKCNFLVREGKLNTGKTVKLRRPLIKEGMECKNKVLGMRCSKDINPCKCRLKGKTLWEKARVYVEIAGKVKLTERWIKFTISDGCMCAVNKVIT